MKQNYVTATLELLQTGMSLEAVLVNLKKVLTSRGHSKLLLDILKALAVELERNADASVATITLASENSVAVSDITEALKKLSAPTDNYHVKINPNIIGGLVAIYGSTQIDQSYQTKLRELYQSIINA